MKLPELAVVLGETANDPGSFFSFPPINCLVPFAKITLIEISERLARKRKSRYNLVTVTKKTDLKTAIQGTLRELAAAAEIGLWFWPFSSEVIECSPTFAELLGVETRSHHSLDSCLSAIDEVDRETVRNAFEESYRERSALYCEFRCTKECGTVSWLALRGKSIKEADGTVVGVGGGLQDVTEAKRVSEECHELVQREKHLREASENAIRVKDEFVAMVSHELRSPLNAILGWARIMQTKQIDTATLRHAVETIERSARAQSKLIEDLIDSARISTGKLRLESHPVNLKKVAASAVDIARPAADAKQVELTLTMVPAPLEVVGDADRLQQVIGNLLSNSVKFTPGGGRIEIDLTKHGQHALIQVRDSGVGIDAEVLPRIFDRFDQAGHTSTRRHGGLGLGLSLVHQLVALHDGSVRAESAGEGKGATFVIQLPLRVDTATGDRAKPARGPIGSNTGPLNAQKFSLSGFNILVVDDDPDARELTSLLLRQHGAEVRPAASAAEAFSTLAASADFLPDLLLSDIGMPDEDGYSLITRIRVLEPSSGGRIPAIALTAFGSNEDRARAFSSGFDAHLTKPVEPNQLVAEIARLAPQGKARRV